jgi:hypothetical protein
MEFAAVLERLAAFFEERHQPYAVVGGVALAAYGILRTTLDLDLAVDRSAQDEIVAFMIASGYETLYRSEGYSNHQHPDPDWGRVDFVYLRGETSAAFFAAVRRVAGLRERTVPVPSPEHLAAMKIQAMLDDPSRTWQELADVRALLLRPDVDRAAVRESFARCGLLERWEEIHRTL